MKQWMIKILILFISPILFLGIMELSFRQFGGDRVRNYYDQQTQMALGKPVPKKAVGEYRAFIFGGSSAYGFPVTDRSSISAWLNQSFTKLLPGLKITVINAAWPGKASHQDLEGAYTSIKYKPDLFIVYTGHNEANIANRIYADSAIYRWNLNLSFRSAFYLWVLSKIEKIEKFFNKGKPVKQYREEIIAQKIYLRVEVTQNEYDQIAYRFEKNIHSILRIARKLKIPVVLVSPASNLHDIVPHFSGHRSDLDKTSLNKWNEFFEKGEKEFSEAKYQDAANSFQEALKIDPEYAKLHLDLARSLEQFGAFEEAGKEFLLARDKDLKPSRAKTQLIGILKKNADEPNVFFVDLEKIYAKDSPHGIIGYEFIYDDVHPTVKGQQIIAEAILKKLSAVNWIKPSAQWKWNEFEKLEKSEVWQTDASHEAYHDILTGLLLWQQKDYKGAYESFERGLISMPGFIESYAFLGDSYYRTQHYEKAISAFKTLEKKDAALEEVLLRKYPDLHESYSNLEKSVLAAS